MPSGLKFFRAYRAICSLNLSYANALSAHIRRLSLFLEIIDIVNYLQHKIHRTPQRPYA